MYVLVACLSARLNGHESCTASYLSWDSVLSRQYMTVACKIKILNGYALAPAENVGVWKAEGAQSPQAEFINPVRLTPPVP